MHTVPGFLLLLTSVTAHSHSHCILSTVPAQTFMWPCWESNRGIDPAKNNSFFFPSQFSGRAVPDVAGLWKTGEQQDQDVRLGDQDAPLASGYVGSS